MLRFLADENFNGDIVRGLLLREPSLDVVRVQDTPLAGSGDPQVLVWAARHNRIVLTHDQATMPAQALERLTRGEEMAGIFVFDGHSGNSPPERVQRAAGVGQSSVTVR